jgi:predicted AlkP superfamily phosphohydrolase/phosphomutase
MKGTTKGGINMDCNRVFIIGLDGAGSFVKAAHSPRIDAILQGGAYTYFAQTVFPTISAECWGALLHGVGPEKHGLNNDVADKDPFQRSRHIPPL